MNNFKVVCISWPLFSSKKKWEKRQQRAHWFALEGCTLVVWKKQKIVKIADLITTIVYKGFYESIKHPTFMPFITNRGPNVVLRVHIYCVKSNISLYV